VSIALSLKFCAHCVTSYSLKEHCLVAMATSIWKFCNLSYVAGMTTVTHMGWDDFFVASLKLWNILIRLFNQSNSDLCMCALLWQVSISSVPFLQILGGLLQKYWPPVIRALVGIVSYERLELPLYIEPVDRMSKPCLQSLVQLPDILSQEEDDVYHRAKTACGSDIVAMIHNSSGHCSLRFICL